MSERKAGSDLQRAWKRARRDGSADEQLDAAPRFPVLERLIPVFRFLGFAALALGAAMVLLQAAVASTSQAPGLVALGIWLDVLVTVVTAVCAAAALFACSEGIRLALDASADLRTMAQRSRPPAQ